MRGIYLNIVAQSWEDERMYLCLWKIEDIERVAGWYPTTRGIRVGELVVWMCLIVHTVWTCCISWLRRPRSYPRLLRYCACVDSLQCSLNVSLNEHIRHILRARLNGKGRLVSKGWHDERKRYWCSAVGLVKRTILMIDTIIEGHLDVENGERFEWAVLPV